MLFGKGWLSEPHAYLVTTRLSKRSEAFSITTLRQGVLYSSRKPPDSNSPIAEILFLSLIRLQVWGQISGRGALG
jgi:hypothetical protein